MIFESSFQMICYWIYFSGFSNSVMWFGFLITFASFMFRSTIWIPKHDSEEKIDGMASGWRMFLSFFFVISDGWKWFSQTKKWNTFIGSFVFCSIRWTHWSRNLVPIVGALYINTMIFWKNHKNKITWKRSKTTKTNLLKKCDFLVVSPELMWTRKNSTIAFPCFFFHF